MKPPGSAHQRRTETTRSDSCDVDVAGRHQGHTQAQTVEACSAGSPRGRADHALRLCSSLATRQQGAVRHDQLRAAGVSPGEIRQLIRAGGLHPRYRGVYIVGHLALAPRAEEAAALLACGPRAVISHRSAAYLWGLIQDRPPEVDVTLVGVRRRHQAGLRLHYLSRLAEADVGKIKGLRITSPARTIVDLAGDQSSFQLEALIAEAKARRRVSGRAG